jgi:hypothetical protein
MEQKNAECARTAQRVEVVSSSGRADHFVFPIDLVIVLYHRIWGKSWQSGDNALWRELTAVVVPQMRD